VVGLEGVDGLECADEVVVGAMASGRPVWTRSFAGAEGRVRSMPALCMAVTMASLDSSKLR